MSEKEKLEVRQNRAARKALVASMYAAVKALTGDMGCNMFRGRHMKATLICKIRLKRMEHTRQE